jgi:hypothetical protein
LILTGSSGLFERGLTRNVPHAPTAEYVRSKMEEILYDPALVTADWVDAVRRIVTTRATARRVLQFARAANGPGGTSTRRRAGRAPPLESHRIQRQLGLSSLRAFQLRLQPVRP